MDVIKALKQMPDESVDMQITSPPYWGLRDYGKGVEVVWDGEKVCKHSWKENIQAAKGGYSEDSMVGSNAAIENKRHPIKSNFCSKCGAWKGQLGLEPDFNLFIKHLCDVFDEVKRVLKKDGICWINLGDTYSGGGGGNYGDGVSVSGSKEKHLTNVRNRKEFIEQIGISAKCLCCIPERFALEMINRGWILRNKIIWHKPNHMPTSVKDRFANSWEYLFLFSKSKKYYFDLDTVREAHIHGPEQKRTISEDSPKTLGGLSYPGETAARLGRTIEVNPKGKNPDDVLEIPHHPKGDENIHSMRLLPQANQPQAFNPLGKNPSDFWDITTKGYPEAHFAVFPEALVERPIKTTRKNAVIMDIFAGSGTTLKVARRLHRDSIGIEIKPEYVELIKKRLFKGHEPLFPNEFEVIK